ncbi:MAG TPA: hypothetical protein VKV35_01190 [Streptosporangiaceae bacterium]|jgi:hypothetical protein|nr:hypothetical protein [Streptosporangiaceae bacterium]
MIAARASSMSRSAAVPSVTASRSRPASAAGPAVSRAGAGGRSLRTDHQMLTASAATSTAISRPYTAAAGIWNPPVTCGLALGGQAAGPGSAAAWAPRRDRSSGRRPR